MHRKQCFFIGDFIERNYIRKIGKLHPKTSYFTAKTSTGKVDISC